MQNFRTELVQLAQKTSDKTGKAISTLAFQAANDGKFFDRLGAGGGCTVDTYLHVKGWLENALNESSGGR